MIWNIVPVLNLFLNITLKPNAATALLSAPLPARPDVTSLILLLKLPGRCNGSRCCHSSRRPVSILVRLRTQEVSDVCFRAARAFARWGCFLILQSSRDVVQRIPKPGCLAAPLIARQGN